MTSGAQGNLYLPSAPTPRELAAGLFRHPRLLLGSIGLVLLATMAMALLSARYESHFKVMLRRGRFDPVASAQVGGLDFTRPAVTEEELNSEVELLRDEDLLRQIVPMAGLLPANTPAAERQATIERESRKISRHLEVTALKKSNLIQVSLSDRNPQRAARILTALATAYERRHTALQRPSGEARFFDQQTADSEKKLHQAETNLVNFTRVRGVVSASMERDIALQKLSEADAAYRQIDQDRVETERTIASLREQLKSFPTRSVTLKRWADNPELLEKLKTHLLELQLKRTELLTRFEPSYRTVQEVDQQIEQAKTAISAEALTPVRDETTDKDPNYEWARMELEKAEVRREALHARQSEAMAQVSLLRSTAEQLQAASVDQQDLLRTAKADEEAYLLYLRKREEARIGDALDQERILNVAVVEYPVAAALPTHSVLAYFLLAFVLSLVFGTAVCFTAEYFDSTIRTPDEAHKLLDMPVLAWLPPAPPEFPNSQVTRIRGPRVVAQ